MAKRNNAQRTREREAVIRHRATVDAILDLLGELVEQVPHAPPLLIRIEMSASELEAVFTEPVEEPRRRGRPKKQEEVPSGAVD